MMGIDAQIINIKSSTEHLRPGTFWCEVFTGDHLSVDYINGKQVMCVKGHRSPQDPLWKWNKWERVSTKVDFPLILQTLQDSSIINCEFIGGKLIEVHQRHNDRYG